MTAKRICIPVIMFLMAGCASTSSEPRYTSAVPENVTFNLTLSEDGPPLTSRKALVGINVEGKDCKDEYRGWVELKPGPTRIGLVPNESTLLVVVISNEGWGGSSSTRIRRGVYLQPEAGKQYEVDVAYVDRMFDIGVYEGSGAQRKPLRTKSRCK